MASDIETCKECWCVAPWVEKPGCRKCDQTWYRRGCGWNKSKKGFWYCPLCWRVPSTERPKALENLCTLCKETAKSIVPSPAPWGYGAAMSGSGILPPAGPASRKRTCHGLPYEDSRAMMGRLGFQKKVEVPARRPPSRSTSSSKSSSSSSSRSPSRTRKRKRSSSSSSKGGRKKVAASNETNDAGETDEIREAKMNALSKLTSIQKMESKEARQKEFRQLLRNWHPDKNPDKIELATAVFQFLQKGKRLLGES